MKTEKCKKCVEHLEEFPRTNEKWHKGHLVKPCKNLGGAYKVCEDFCRDKRRKDGLYSYCRPEHTKRLLKIYHAKKAEQEE